MKIFKIATLFAISTALVAGCGQQSDKASCTPNFTGTGMSALVTKLHDNSDGTTAYSVELCADVVPSGAIYSVYGANGNTPVTDTTNSVRLQRVEDSSFAGAKYEVNFESFDTFFFIYEDVNSGGTFQMDTTHELMHGDLSQAADPQ